jgi:small subunit ribosomal protein S17
MSTKTKSNKKTLNGTVVSNKMDKTVVVSVDRTYRHPEYKKVITRSKKYYAHDESNSLEEGTPVTIMETRPYSKTKCWRVVAGA